MPRAGQTKPPVMPRLSDRIAIGVLTRTFPPELVDRVITQTGRGERRQRLLPARVVVYYTSRCACSPWWATRRSGGCWWRGWRGPGAGRAVGRSRTRARSPGPGHGLGRRRCGRCLWKSPGRGQGAVLQVRLVGLVECGTHAVVDAAMGGLHLGEGSLAPLLGRSLGPGMLLLVDQGLCGLELWRTFHATGAELVWRCRQDVTLEVLEVLADGSWASELGASQARGKRVAVRVIGYRLDDPGRPGEPQGYRLITTIMDPERAPAAELPALYPQRWELETALDELKTHQRGPGVVLRSTDPDGVRQEVWALCWSTTPSARSCTRPPCRPRSTLTGCRLPAACTSRGAR
jgi:hypothetical protein